MGKLYNIHSMERDLTKIKPSDKTPDQITDESETAEKYIELPEENVTLLCSYTTRIAGFIDILLSGHLLSSRQASNLLGRIQTHRDLKSDDSQTRSTYASENDYISFSTGFVSFNYSDRAIRRKEDYIGGYGFFTPLKTLLTKPNLRFSHCSKKGGIYNYDLNRDNIQDAVHIARKEGQLFDDGYGNVFEVQYHPCTNNGNSTTKYPRIPIEEGIIGIPYDKKEEIQREIIEKQAKYSELIQEINRQLDQSANTGVNIPGRYIINPETTKDTISQMLEPIDLSQLPIYWYKQRNLDLALQALSQSSDN